MAGEDLDTISLLIISGAGVATFALLLRSGAVRGPARTAAIAVAALAAINIAGAIGLAWIVVEMLTHDGVMAFELALCAALIAMLAAATIGGLALRRRGRVGAAITLLALAALPTLAVFGFLLYLDSHPIDMK